MAKVSINAFFGTSGDGSWKLKRATARVWEYVSTIASHVTLDILLVCVCSYDLIPYRLD